MVNSDREVVFVLFSLEIIMCDFVAVSQRAPGIVSGKKEGEREKQK